ncbi:katanin p60 ATPase-containing subunit [Achlya hypogyna]|uniref:Katanin p60 ATPase-containing subunit n=1 Tax=Achlya hypogyna TaxID=1202772 RepID=A0A1V9YLS2_ACHHY|nr:katanin p60 ATPase-containing subunit [Achlya hypogyna]
MQRERDGGGYGRLRTSYLVKYLLMCFFLAADMALNASAEYMELGTAFGTTSAVSVVLAQAFVQIVGAINLFILLGTTFPFRNGLLGLLGSQFRAVLWMQFIYFITTIVMGISRISILSNSTTMTTLWDHPGYYLLSCLQKLAMIPYCHLTLDALTTLGDAKYYTKEAWISLRIRQDPVALQGVAGNMLHAHEIRAMGEKLSTAREQCMLSSYEKGIGIYRGVLGQLKPAIKKLSQMKERQDWLQVESELEAELAAILDYVDLMHGLKTPTGARHRKPAASPSDRPSSGGRWQVVESKPPPNDDPDVWAPPSPDRRRGAPPGSVPNWADNNAKRNHRFNAAAGQQAPVVRSNPPARLANRAPPERGAERKPRPAAVPPKKATGSTPGKDAKAPSSTPKKPGEKPKYSDMAREQGWVDLELIEGIERDIVDNGPKITFDDIAGLEHTKALLQEAVMLPQIAPHLFKDGRLKPCNGVLMFGPPGTGKTLLAKAVANVCNSTFFNVSASTLASKYRGESEKMVRILFEMARYYSPAIIFMDEIDAIAGARGGAEEHESSRRVKTELLVQINGVGSGEKTDIENNRVMVLAATNLPWQIDEAMRRRLTKRVYIPLPDLHGRRALFQLNLKKVDVADDVNYDTLATTTEGYSGDDICGVCETAKMFPVKRLYTPEYLVQLQAKRNEGAGDDEIKAMEKNGLVVTMVRAATPTELTAP